MFLVSVFRSSLFLLAPLSFILTSYLYLYPVFHQCTFPSSAPDQDNYDAYINTLHQHLPGDFFGSENTTYLAPFRLLALGDPQLEGDSSIPDPSVTSFPHFWKFWEDALLLNGKEHSFLQRIRHSLHDLIDLYFDDIPKTLDGYRKRLDLFGNDFYLAHIYRTMHWWTNPTHVSVLGDLLGSQWVDDDEFARRSWRFWNHVMKGGERISDNITAPRQDGDTKAVLLGDEAKNWTRRIINIAGNHDIGYAGDLNPERFERFEHAFGRANYELRFQLNDSLSATQKNPGEVEEEEEEREVPELRIIVLNDMNLDTPATSGELQSETYNFLNKMITNSHHVERSGHFTLLLTHIPLHKEHGICVDAPFFDFYEADGEFQGGVKEQNHLSMDASKGILEGIFGMSGDPSVEGAGIGRKGLIMTGHDHEGCDVYHYIGQSEDPSSRAWQAERWPPKTEIPSVPGLREITVRSMMGDFQGNAGLLSLWFDRTTWTWQFQFATCSVGPPWIWWAVHVTDIIVLILGAFFLALRAMHRLGLEVSVGFRVQKRPRPLPRTRHRRAASMRERSIPVVRVGMRERSGSLQVGSRQTMMLKRTSNRPSLVGAERPNLAAIFEIPNRQ